MEATSAGQQSDTLSRQLREKALISFAQQTTAHGIVRLTQGSSLRRLIWALAIMGACIGFSLHLAELAQRYLSYPVSTEFSNEGADFQFPTVTICPTDNFVDFCQPVPLFIPMNYFRCLQDMVLDNNRVYKLLGSENWNASLRVFPYNYYHHGRLSLRAVAYRGNLFQQPYETVLYCRYNSQPCSFENFTTYKDEEGLMCISFTPTNRTIVNAGPGNGLYLVLHHVTENYLTDEEQIDYVPGFQVALHESGFKPDMSLGFKVPFGQKTTARVYAETVTKVNRDATPCSKNLPNVTYTMNYSYPDNFENQSFFGDYQDCVIRIKQEEFRDTCGCLGTHLPLPSELMNDTLVCHQLPDEVLHQNIYAVTFRHDDGTVGHTDYRISNWTEPDDRSFDFDKLIMLSDYLKDNWDSLNFNRSKTFLRCYDQVLNRQKSQGVTTTNCKVRCTKTRYRDITTTSSWPKDFQLAAKVVQRYAKQTLDRIQNTSWEKRRLQRLYNNTNFSLFEHPSLSVLDLHPMSTKTSVFTESFAYLLRNLFSDLGGILGLWVGVSIVTLVEMLELLIDMAKLVSLRLLVSSRSKARVHPHDPEENSQQNAVRNIYKTGVFTYGDHPESKSFEFAPHFALPPKPPEASSMKVDEDCKNLVKHRPSLLQKLLKF